MTFLVLGILNLIATIIVFICILAVKQPIFFLIMIPQILNCIMLFKLYDINYYQNKSEEEIEKLRIHLNECRKLLNLPLMEENEVFACSEESLDKNSPDYFDENSPDFEDAFLLEQETNTPPPPQKIKLSTMEKERSPVPFFVYATFLSIS